MEKGSLCYFISSPSLWHWKLAGSAVVGAGGRRANEGWACTLTDGTSVFMYGIPQVILRVPCPIVPWSKKENTTNLPSPAGGRDPTPKQSSRRTPARFWGFYSRATRREQWQTARGRGARGDLSPVLAVPWKIQGCPEAGGARGAAQPRRWTERAVSRARPFVLRHCDSLC